MLLGTLKKIFRMLRFELKLNKEESEFNRTKQLKGLYSVFGNSPEMDRSVGRSSALGLYKAIKKYNPKNILEFGTGIGCSSAIMALASGENTKITTLESKEFYIKTAEQLIPKELRHKISFVLSRFESFVPNGLKHQVFSGYREIPQSTYDFVLIDGPDEWEDNGLSIKLPNGDLFKIINWLEKGALIFIDSRKESVRCYKKCLENELRVIEDNGGRYTILKKI